MPLNTPNCVPKFVSGAQNSVENTIMNIVKNVQHPAGNVQKNAGKLRPNLKKTKRENSMSEINYTKDKNGLQKMRALMNMTKVVMLATNLKKTPFSVCPMTIQELDERGDLWFFSDKTSRHFKEIESDNKVQLMYMDEEAQTYISIFGHATHIIDAEKLNQLWNPKLKKWFTGKDDPNLTLLNVNMENAYYWENTKNELVSFFNPIHSVLVDHKTTTGNKGYVNLQNH